MGEKTRTRGALRAAATVAMAVFAACANAASHREAPLIAFDDRGVDNTDIYVFNEGIPGAPDAIYLIGRSGFDAIGLQNEIIAAQLEREQFDRINGPAHMTFFPIYTDTDPKTNPALPQIAVSPNGQFLAGYTLDTDFFSGPPFLAPTNIVRRFDVNGGPVGPPLPVGSAGSGQLGAALAPVIGQTDAYFASYFNFDAAGFSYELQKIVGGVADPTFGAVPTVDPNPGSEPTTAIAGTRDGGVVRLRTGNAGAQFPNPGDVLVVRYDANGNRIMPEQAVNTAPVFNPGHPAIDVADDGTAYAVFAHIDPVTFGSRVTLAKIVRQQPVVDLDNLELPDFGSGGAPRNPDVATNTDGVVTVVYDADTNDPVAGFDRGDVYMRRFLPNGTAFGGITRVNSLTSGTQQNAHVDDAGDGGFYVVFETDGTTTGHNAIFGIDFAPPFPTGPNTVAATDFGTPWTDTTVAGFTVASDAPANTAGIAANPDAPDSTDGVLRFDFLDPNGGTILAAFNEDRAAMGFPNGRRFGDDVIATELLLLSSSMDSVSVFGEFSAFDAANPDNAVLTRSFAYLERPQAGRLVGGDGPAAANVGAWTTLSARVPLTAEEGLLLASFDDPRFAYAVGVNAAGPGPVIVDDLRIDLTPIPLPGALWLLAPALGLIAGQHPRRCRTATACPDS